MRITVDIDNELLSKAQRLTGTFETTVLVKASLTALIERESAKRLVLLGGTEENLQSIPRRQTHI